MAETTLETMHILPKDVADRFESIFLQEPELGVKQLEAIIEDLYELVQLTLPQIDVTEEYENSLSVRPFNQ